MLSKLAVAAVLIGWLVPSAQAQEAHAARVVFQVGTKVVSLLVEQRANITVGILSAAIWDATKASVTSAFGGGGSTTPPSTCAITGNASVDCGGIGKITLPQQQPLHPNWLTTQPCAIFTTPETKAACEGNVSPRPLHTFDLPTTAPSYTYTPPPTYYGWNNPYLQPNRSQNIDVSALQVYLQNHPITALKLGDADKH